MRKEPTKRAWVPSGPIVRTRKAHKEYNQYRRRVKINEDCVFCTQSQMQNPQKRKTFWIVDNRFGYAIWDGCKVLDHKMVVPIRHVKSIGELTDQEKLDYTGLIGEYEQNGYALYSRSVDGVTRSVFHLHTHLIKLDTKPIKHLVYLQKPHVLFYKD